MRAIELPGVVSADGTLTLTSPVPAEIPPGPVRVTVEAAPADGGAKPFPYNLAVLHGELLDPTNTFRREDLYDDDGR